MYQPPVLRSGTKSIFGRARVRFSTDGNLVQVLLQDKNPEVPPKEIRLDRSACPTNLFPGEWNVKLSQNYDKMYSFSPVQGTFVVALKQFISQENQEPKPELYTPEKYEPYERFNVMFEILEPKKYGGVTIVAYYHYNFGPAMQDGKEVVAFTKAGGKNAVHTPKLMEFLRIFGAWDLGPIEWKDNILPELQRRMLHAQRKAQVMVKDGWIDSMVSYEEPSEEDDDLPWDAAPSGEAAVTTTTQPTFSAGDEEIDFQPKEEPELSDSEFVD